MLTFDEVVILVEVKIIGYDESKNHIEEKVEAEVFCNEKSISRVEFYNAGSQGLKPSYILVLHDFEYEGQEKVIYKNQELQVLKTYRNNDYIELTVGEKIGN
ncbi:phage head closure protein [Miniphocaeibacter massiliensis]|uniref:phage head closure protein n=1 Tax=Miniphocaeibacter massiliensis TaxID=2041841 RepID=UPI000C1C324A|nr:phage head closure protein [Miniphocaeibacter massiliensis]